MCYKNALIFIIILSIIVKVMIMVIIIIIIRIIIMIIKIIMIIIMANHTTVINIIIEVIRYYNLNRKDRDDEKM